MKKPKFYQLRESQDWVKWKFGVKGHARGALTHINRCLDEIASREYDLLMSKANILGYLQRWDELKVFLRYLNSRYPNDPELFCHHADFQKAHGNWEEALKFLIKAEKRMKSEHSHFRESLYLNKMDCLVALKEGDKAISEAKRILKKNKNYSILRSYLKRLINGNYHKVEVFASDRD